MMLKGRVQQFLAFATLVVSITANSNVQQVESVPGEYIVRLKPNVIAIPTWVIASPDMLLITIAPVPQNTNIKVPIISATYFFMLIFFKCLQKHKVFLMQFACSVHHISYLVMENYQMLLDHHK